LVLETGWLADFYGGAGGGVVVAYAANLDEPGLAPLGAWGAGGYHVRADLAFRSTAVPVTNATVVARWDSTQRCEAAHCLEAALCSANQCVDYREGEIVTE
jgi:hypothetical protein